MLKPNCDMICYYFNLLSDFLQIKIFNYNGIIYLCQLLYRNNLFKYIHLQKKVNYFNICYRKSFFLKSWIKKIRRQIYFVSFPKEQFNWIIFVKTKNFAVHIFGSKPSRIGHWTPKAPAWNRRLEEAVRKIISLSGWCARAFYQRRAPAHPQYPRRQGPRRDAWYSAS